MILTDKEKSDARELLLKYYDALGDVGIAFILNTAQLEYEHRFDRPNGFNNAAAASTVREILAADKIGQIVYFPTEYDGEGE